jgi:hypothetical protein
MFEGSDDKPVSCVITTLAATAYQKETNIMQGLMGVVDRMPSFIQDKYDSKTGKMVQWIANPINEVENFADKWVEQPKKQENFYKWLNQVKQDVLFAADQRGLYKVQEALASPFGKGIVSEAFNKLGENARLLRENSQLHVAAQTGMLGATGTVVRNHNFYGKKEQ